MRIIQMKINNFRNLDDCFIKFNAKSNYLVGKNNIGKTSTLDLIDKIFSGDNFLDSDFSDIQNSIKINAKIQLNDDEIGFFDDNFSTDSCNEINLEFIQENPDSQLVISSKLTDDKISRNQIRRTNYIGFSSNRKPIRENDLTKQYGEYKIIPYLIKKYISSNNEDIFNTSTDDSGIVEYINDSLSMIKPFKKNDIFVGVDDDYFEYILRALKVKGPSSIDFSKMGFGTQFSSIIPLVILDKIIYWDHYGHLNDHICSYDNGKKELNIILGLDEPEVHLHPNLQLSVIKDIKELLSGKDNDFNELLKSLFDIDKIIGQLIVVTHSPSIISNNYHEYIRYVNKDEKLNIISGEDISLPSKQEKQLEMQLPYVKNSLFADSVIFVEGETEQGAMPVFAKKLSISLIEKNTNIINAGGVDSIPALQELFENLGIKNISVIDNDGKNRNYYRSYVTNKYDFESECLSKMHLTDINNYLYEVDNTINNSNYRGTFFDDLFGEQFKEDRIRVLKKQGDIKDYINEYIKNSFYEFKSLDNNMNEKLKKQFKNKSILNGQIIADNLFEVPSVYQNVLHEATK